MTSRASRSNSGERGRGSVAGRMASAGCIVCLSAMSSGIAVAQDDSGGSETGGSDAVGGAEADFNYDDGSGRVTIVDYNRTGSQEIARAAREGRALKIQGVTGSRRGRLGKVPEYHRVVRGDTLWDLSQHYYANPWGWPRIWSFNPEITNPNWIYPGDRLRLKEPGTVVEPVARDPRPGFGWAKGYPTGTVFQRSRGFIDREALETMGTIVGSREEVEMLAEHDEAYIEFPEDEDANIGDEYTVFRVRDDVEPAKGGRRNLGVFVEIMGAARVVSYDPDENIARAVITESINPIERGYRVGPLRRRYEIISPVQNQVDLEGRIVMAVEPIDLYAENHLVFIDRGQEDGVQEGNRLFIRRRRDSLRAANDERDDRAGYPYEIIAELRVVEVRQRTATCLVTRSVTDIHAGDTWEMRRGY